jgi:hypothetical protein
MNYERRGEGHVASKKEKRNAYVHVKNCLKNILVWSSRCKWEANIKMDFRESVTFQNVVLNWFSTGPIGGIL